MFQPNPILKVRTAAVFIGFFTFISCTTDYNVDSDITSIAEASDTTEIDSLAIQQKIMDHYREEYTYFDDSLNIQITDFHYHGHIVCSLNLNGDEWDDYFVIVDYMGGPTIGEFFDGKTAELYEYNPTHTHVLSRPGVDIEYEVIDINCGDNQQELLIRSGGGGTIGNYYDCEIYRFDKASNRIKLIFEETISAFEWEEGEEKELEVNHVDLNYTNSSCVDEIIVREGKLEEPRDIYSLNISPKQNGIFWRYGFNADKNEFQLLETSAH